MKKPRILIAGAGIAGSLAVSEVCGREDLDLICLERSIPAEQGEAGTGLNLGPNGMRTLEHFQPPTACRLFAQSYPWRRWTVGLTNGRLLMDLPLERVADTWGIRIRWSVLYALLRAPLEGRVRYGQEILACQSCEDGTLSARVRDAASGTVGTVEDLDLIVGADGRYSQVRESLLGPPAQQFLDVHLFRTLIRPAPDAPIDDYAQWFNGPNRLLAYRIPQDWIYLAGSFPTAPDAPAMDAPPPGEALRDLYSPSQSEPGLEAGYLIEALAHPDTHCHWSRLQECPGRFTGPKGVVFLGDAAHPMVPTLGQGATQAIEDGCVLGRIISKALETGCSLSEVPRQVAMAREERVDFVTRFSREASDTMLAGADPVAGTLRKTEPEFLENLERLYLDTPEAA